MPTAHRFLVLSSVLASALLSSVAPAGSAPSGFDRCPAGHFCLFDGPDGTGLMASFRTGSPDLARQSMDNRASSLADNVPDTVWCIYDERDYAGTEYQRVYPGAAGNFEPEWDDRVSSTRLGECSP
ncbi:MULTISPECIES: peptidase inhibitor family I36 protein [Streptomyces]|uniref:Peptidase inhibitor family I36 protein n=1 Tax=Streptomyces solicathayae TaxID=3081768 RepID=A0ABZ0LQ31_9ACTN|nr:peptidase inhibitor family I36 protein [Streptomyces sp. HUAS YS2]WOX21425.1 peptidase inhibitor family I36 protein [Streptomyces sp. HUAS YS2]